MTPGWVARRSRDGVRVNITTTDPARPHGATTVRLRETRAMAADLELDDDETRPPHLAPARRSWPCLARRHGRGSGGRARVRVVDGGGCRAEPVAGGELRAADR